MNIAYAVSYALGQTKLSLIHAVHRWLNASAYARHENIVKDFRGAGGFKHGYQLYKLFSLARILDQRRPRNILELGSGSSTALFADYVRRNEAHLTTLDESEHWLDNASRMAHVEPGDARFTMVHASRIVEQPAAAPPEIRYDWDPAEHYDLVFVDGPSMRVDGDRRKDAVNTDVFRLIADKPPATIVVDIRAATVAALCESVSDRYRVQVSDLVSGGAGYNYDYFSVFTLKPGTGSR